MTTPWPSLSRLRAIASPMIPRPRKPYGGAMAARTAAQGADARERRGGARSGRTADGRRTGKERAAISGC